MTTLADVEAVVARHSAALAEHPFLQRLEAAGSRPQLEALVSRLTFFVLAFQDMLRLADTSNRGRPLAPVIEGMRRDDHGHDRWFVTDVRRLGAPLDAVTLFSSEHAAARDTSYAILSELRAAEDDRVTLAILLSLEATAKEFFERVPAFAEKLGVTDLIFFGRPHVEAEASHEAFADAGRAQWMSTEVPDELLLRLLGAVERTFAAMVRLADDLDAAMSTAESDPASPGSTVGKRARVHDGTPS